MLTPRHTHTSIGKGDVGETHPSLYTLLVHSGANFTSSIVGILTLGHKIGLG